MIEIDNRKNRCYCNIFNDLSELVKYVETKPSKSDRNDSSQNKGDDFSGTSSLEDAINLMKYGDDALFNKIKDKRKKLNIDRMLGNVNNKAKYEKRVYGCMPNVPAYLTGNPLNMINVEKTELSTKVVNIFINVCYPWSVDKDNVIETGTTYLNVLDLLEKAGYRVNLYCGVATNNCDNYPYMLVRVKTDREPFNLRKASFPIAHPSMLRRIYFKWTESCDSSFDGTRCGYGSYDGKSHIKEMIKDLLKQDYIIWDYTDNNGRVTLDKVIKNLEENGIAIK